MLTILLSTTVAATTPTEEDLVQAWERELIYPSSLRNPNGPTYVAHCRKAEGGCRPRLQAFAKFVTGAVTQFPVDPWVVAAMMLKESGLNPFAVGASMEVGVLQIHPKNKYAKHLQFVRDLKYRENCKKEVGACQRDVIDMATWILASSIEKCGSLEKGLAMYNAGDCNADTPYPRLVLKIRDRLMENRS